MNPSERTGGLAAWSIRHPVGVSMIALAVVVLGLVVMGRIAVDLLPQIIYPEIRVRILDPGVPARIMEDRVTRQLEEQLAITEGVVAVQSSSTEGTSTVDLSFPYGHDIDVALREASTRLDRARRFLPDTADAPIIFKRDPSQIPVAEFVVSSDRRDSVALRDWVDYDFRLQFLNLPGVAAVEVGGGLLREIHVLPDQERLDRVGLRAEELADALRQGNLDTPMGRLTMTARELGGRTSGRFRSVDEIASLPLRLGDGTVVPLSDLAEVKDTHADERIMVRFNGNAGVQLTVQKQPEANTVAVVDAVNREIARLERQALLPPDITVERVSDQAVYVRNALNNASMAALAGMLLAMSVVYLFLGDLRRTLVVGTAIPLAVLVTFTLMGAGGLSFNIMTLGGLALGVGMLVDNTIVMLENIYRHQRHGEQGLVAGRAAAAEINSAIVAATSTNLAAVLPFLFVSGLIGLLFRELIITISAAILASMVVALTLVPALGVRVPVKLNRQALMDRPVNWLREHYGHAVAWLLRTPLAQGGLLLLLVTGLWLSASALTDSEQQFLPNMDEGAVQVRLFADPGISVEAMDRHVRTVEQLIQAHPDVESLFSVVGGFVFGRSAREMSNRAFLNVKLVPRSRRTLSADGWIQEMQKTIRAAELAGLTVRMRTPGIRGIRVGSGEDDISLRIQGPDLDQLARLGDQLTDALRPVTGLRNVAHSAEELRQELTIELDRTRAADLGFNVAMVGQQLQLALDGRAVTDFLEGDRSYVVRLRLPQENLTTTSALGNLLLANGEQRARLSDLAEIRLAAEAAEIKRDRQRRIVEVSASLTEDATLAGVYAEIEPILAGLALPEGYAVYDGGGLEQLQQGQQLGTILLGLALFLVFVVMAVQYESLRNPLVIMLSVPFAAIGVALGLQVAGLPVSMPVWLGLIMLAGIVVNNAIVLVEYIELGRARGLALQEAIVEAGRLRLRPILMTTLTTVFGMLPLALGLGEGAEMLQPLAVTLVSGLSLSLIVTLALIPIIYRTLHYRAA